MTSSAMLRQYLGARWGTMTLATGATLLSVAGQLARPFPFALVIDRLLEGRSAPFAFDSGDVRLLALLAALVLFIALADAAGAYASDVLLKRAGEDIVDELRVDTHRHLQRLSLGYHERRHTGDLVTRVTGDVNAVGELFSQSLGTIVSSLLLLLGMIVVSVVIDPVLALVMFVVIPLLGFVTVRFRRRLKTAAREQRAREGEIASLTTESLSAAREVRALGSEDFEDRRLRTKSEERRRAGVMTSVIESRFTGLLDVLGAVGTAAVLVVGALRVAAGAISVGDLIVMHSYVRRTYRPLRDIARQAGRMSRAMARADRIAEILAADDVPAERPDAYRGRRAAGHLSIEEVGYAYEPDRPALRGISLEVTPGETVAVVGRSGAGKSTLAALIARFYDPSSGRVTIDGRDVRDCSQAWLREQIGLVLQDTILFTGTVAENIAYGLDHAEREEVVAAAQAAGAHGFISELPDGYDTALGPRGVRLSGGQRQRIAIARTLLRNPPILVLDEPTTGLDPESEAQVLKGLGALMRGRTTLLITHSMALARRADRVAVIDAGCLIDSGPPEQLLSRPGVFLDLAREQGVLGDAAAPARRPSRPPAPPDAALPTMPRLLDPEEMSRAFQRQLPDGAPAPDVRLRYLRYKPATNLVVHYDVDAGEGPRHATAMIASRAYLERRAAKPENRRLAALVNGRSGVPTPLAYDRRVEALLQWLPLDISLPALAVPPAELRSALAGAGVTLGDGDPEVLAYKPRRRAVVRHDGHVLKYYESDAAFSAAATGLRAAMRTGVPVPPLAAAVPALRLTAQAYLPGRAVAGAGEVARRAAGALSVLHASDVIGPPVFGPDRQYAAAAASARLVTCVAPDLRMRVERLTRRLARTAPPVARLVPAHGDFNARQLLECGDELVLTDFDEMCMAPAALDMATYLAYLMRGAPEDLEHVRTVLEELVAGYGERPAALDWYLASMILRRAPRPFRYLDADWPTRVEEMVRAAEATCPQ